MVKFRDNDLCQGGLYLSKKVMILIPPTTDLEILVKNVQVGER